MIRATNFGVSTYVSFCGGVCRTINIKQLSRQQKYEASPQGNLTSRVLFSSALKNDSPVLVNFNFSRQGTGLSACPENDRYPYQVSRDLFEELWLSRKEIGLGG